MRFISLFAFALLLATYSLAQHTPAGAELIGVRKQASGLGTTRTYQYGKAEGLRAEQILPVIVAHGTVRQRRQARRLQRSERVANAMISLGMVGFASTGLFGPADVTTRRVVGTSGLAVFSISMLAAPLQNRRIGRLVAAYNDTMLAQLPYNSVVFPNAGQLTLNDTVTLTGTSFRYREIPYVLPTRTSGFDLAAAEPRLGAGGVAAVGLAAAGGLLLSGSAVAALFDAGDYRRTAWTGLGLTGLGLSLAIPIRHRTRDQSYQKLATRIREYNQFVRDQNGR